MSRLESQIGHHFDRTRAAVRPADGGVEVVTTPVAGGGEQLSTAEIADMPAGVQRQLADAVSELVDDKEEQPAWTQVRTVSWPK